MPIYRLTTHIAINHDANFLTTLWFTSLILYIYYDDDTVKHSSASQFHAVWKLSYWSMIYNQYDFEHYHQNVESWTFLHAHRRVCNVFFPFKMHCIECCSACSWGPRDLLEELAYKKNQTSRLLAKHGPSPQSRVSVQKQRRKKKSVATWTSAFFL